MSNELQCRTGVSGQFAYSIIERMDGATWSTVVSGWVDYVAADLPNYDVLLTERGSSGRYYGTFPTAINIGRYRVRYFVAATLGNPTEFDTYVGEDVIEWNGDEVVSLAYAGTRFGPGEATHVYATGVSSFETAAGNVSFTETANAAGTSVTRAAV